jgi:hypothetical protein
MDYVKEITALIEQMTKTGALLDSNRDEASKAYRGATINTQLYLTEVKQKGYNFNTEKQLAKEWMEAGRLIKKDALSRRGRLLAKATTFIYGLIKKKSGTDKMIDTLLKLSTVCDAFAFKIAANQIEKMPKPSNTYHKAMKQGVDYAQASYRPSTPDFSSLFRR